MRTQRRVNSHLFLSYLTPRLCDRRLKTHQVECFTVRFDFMLLHVFDKAAVSVSVLKKKKKKRKEIVSNRDFFFNDAPDKHFHVGLLNIPFGPSCGYN